MKGYKAFEKGLVCRDKQYKENTVFEEEKAVPCECGMHFCEYPLDVWKYYPPVKDGKLTEYAQVEALDEPKTEDNEKWCSKKLKIGAKIGIPGLIQACVDYVINKAEKNDIESNTDSYSVSTNTGDRSISTNTGYRSVSTSTGDYSISANTGDSSATINTGFYSASTNTGNYSASINTGNYSANTNTGYCSVSTSTGDYSVSTNTGKRSISANTGDCSVSTNTGDCSISTNTGSCSASTVSGEDSIAIACGPGSMAKGAKGCYIALAEWKWSAEKCRNVLLHFKTKKVDGEIIKADTFYKLVNGKFVEVVED